MNGNTDDEPDDIQLPLIAKHPPVRLKPTLDVDVAWPEMFKPDSVVVPKPVFETCSHGAVVLPTHSENASPATELTDNRADGVDVPTPIFPAFVTTKFVAVDDPIANAGAVPFADVGLIDSCAHGVDVPTPSFPVASTRSISVPPVNDPSLLIVNTALLSLLFVSSQILNAPSAPTLASFTYAMFPLNLDVPITWKAAIGRYVPIPTLPDVLSTYIDCDEVPTVNNPLPHGDDVPTAKE